MVFTLEKIDGLPFTGAPANHYHRGNPTPWAQGFVVRLTNANGESWIGNFQGGDSYHSELAVWPEASLFIVNAAGACYLVSAESPEQYVCHQETVTGLMFNEDRTKVFVPDYNDLYAYDRSANVVWRHKDLAADGIVLEKCEAGFIIGRACDDPPEVWVDFKLREADGLYGSV